MRPPSNDPDPVAVARAQGERLYRRAINRAWRIATAVIGVLGLAAVLVVALLRGEFAGL